MSLAIVSCQEAQRATPRPHMFPKIDYPTREVKMINLASCPFKAAILQYAAIKKKEDAFKKEVAHPCWFDMEFLSLGATVHCSYYAIGPDRDLASLIDDAYTMASKHNVKASFREEIEIKNLHGATGLIFSIEGAVASPYQFYITDSKLHFLRGSLYFDDKVDRDSVAPIISFLKKDIDAFLSTVNFE
jgi:gliding motility-associated lipoprotein GldD